MQPMNREAAAAALHAWTGRDVFIHLEVNPGAYWRNGRARLARAHIKGDGPYRVYLELDEGQGLIHIDDVTHLQVEPELVIFTAYDDLDRIARTLEVSLRPFAV